MMANIEETNLFKSCEIVQSNTLASTAKSSFHIPDGEDTLLRIISSNLAVNYTKQANLDLKTAYRELKAEVIESEYTKDMFMSQIKELNSLENKCSLCKFIDQENKNSKKALDEAIKISNLLLNKIYELSS